MSLALPAPLTTWGKVYCRLMKNSQEIWRQMDHNPRSIAKRKKIGLFLASQPHHGGTFQYNLTMLEAVAALPKETYDVVIAYPHQEFLPYLQDHKITSLYTPRGLWERAVNTLMRQSRLPVSWQRAISPYALGIARRLIDQHCDLWIFASQESLAYEIPVPAIMVIHDLMHRYAGRFPEVSASGQFARRERHYKNVCRWARGILAESERGKEQVVECYGPDPAMIYVLPSVPARYLYDIPNQEEPESASGLPPKYFFYPSQFWEHKNHKRLIQAMALLKNSHPDIQLILVGSQKNAYLSARALVDKLGLAENVHFLGYRPEAEMAGLYRRARALVMPTFFGPTNIPPREAIALGCPVAVSDVDGMREQMGEAALYFNPESVAEMAQVMERLWEDDALCQELARRGLIQSAQWTQSHFNARLRRIIDSMWDQQKKPA
jgi:glycosyltransferase involved in cell wall biosynthesis